MKNPLFIQDNIVNKISYYHFLFLLASMPFDRFYSMIIFISFSIHTLLHFKIYQLKSVLQKKVLIAQSVFFVTVFCTFYTLNLKQAFSEWEKQITIFLFPVLFCLITLDIKKYKLQLLLTFACICTLTVAYLYIDAFIRIHSNNLPPTDVFSAAYINHNFSRPVGIHATYLSMYTAFSLACFIYFFISETYTGKKIFYLICSFILFAGLIQFCSKSVFIAFIFIVNIILPYFLLHGLKRVKFIVVSLLISTIFIAAIANIEVFKNRYFTDLGNDLTKNASGSSEDSRLIRWESAIEVIKEAPFSGYGTGSEVAVLKEKYFTNKLYNSFVMELNAHNQYLSFLIRSGIPGLIVYLYVLGFGFIYALKRKDFLFMSFMVLISTVSLSENILDVNKGIIFYSFFLSFFLLSDNHSKKADEAPVTI